jgi:hypothetical protein
LPCGPPDAMEEDPGWGPVLSRLKWLAIPFVGPLLMRRARTAAAMDPVTSFRLIYAGLVFSLLTFAWVLLLIVERDRWFVNDQSNWYIWVVLVACLADLLFLRLVRSRPLKLDSPGLLAGSYRGLTFIGIGIAESGALIAFVGVFVMGTYWIYLVGLAFALFGLSEIGPTRREIQRRQQQIEEQGSSLSLITALMSPGSGQGTQSSSRA